MHIWKYWRCKALTGSLIKGFRFEFWPCKARCSNSWTLECSVSVSYRNPGLIFNHLFIKIFLCCEGFRDTFVKIRIGGKGGSRGQWVAPAIANNRTSRNVTLKFVWSFYAFTTRSRLTVAFGRDKDMIECILCLVSRDCDTYFFRKPYLLERRTYVFFYFMLFTYCNTILLDMSQFIWMCNNLLFKLNIFLTKIKSGNPGHQCYRYPQPRVLTFMVFCVFNQHLSSIIMLLFTNRTTNRGDWSEENMKKMLQKIFWEDCRRPIRSSSYFSTG